MTAITSTLAYKGTIQRWQQELSTWGEFLRSGLWLEINENGHAQFQAAVSIANGVLSSRVCTMVNVDYENDWPTLTLDDVTIANKYGHDGRIKIGANQFMLMVDNELIIVTPDQLCVRIKPN